MYGSRSWLTKQHKLLFNVCRGSNYNMSSLATELKTPINGDMNTRLSIDDMQEHINSNFSGLIMSPTLGLNEMQNLLQYEGRDIYKFGFGQSPMPVPQCLINKLIQPCSNNPSRCLYDNLIF